MKEKLTKLWLSVWLYVITLIAGIVLGCLISNWSVWSLQTKLFAFATMLLPLHVLEEWYFPGGFHTMYNLMQKSDKLDRYPMNQLSDMWTNFIGVIFGCIVLIVGVNPVFMFATVYKGNIIKNLIMDCQSYTKYRPNETTGGIFVSWRRKEELPTGA